MKRTSKIIQYVRSFLLLGLIPIPNMRAESTFPKLLAATAVLSGSLYGAYWYRTSCPVNPPVIKEFSAQDKIPYDDAEGVASIVFHGLGASADHAQAYAQVLPGRVFGFDFPDAPNEVGFFRAHTGLCQPVEVDHCKDALRQVGDIEGIKRIFVFGISRGGATAINLLKEKEIPYREKIIGVSTESPFASVDDIIKHRYKKLGISWMPHIVGHAVVKMLYMQHSLLSHNQPIDRLNDASEDAKKIPVFMACSKADDLIPASSSERLMQQMQQAGFCSIEGHTFEHGPHANILWHKNSRQYLNALYNFFQDRLSETA